jgi:hypothetical protein
MDNLELKHGSCEAVWKEDRNGWYIYPSEDNKDLHEEIYAWLKDNNLIHTILLRTKKPNYIFARKKVPVMR